MQSLVHRHGLESSPGVSGGGGGGGAAVTSSAHEHRPSSGSGDALAVGSAAFHRCGMDFGREGACKRAGRRARASASATALGRSLVRLRLALATWRRERRTASGSAPRPMRALDHARSLSTSLVADDDAPPPSFLCPIMGDLMRDPVTCADGHSYERVNIARWLQENDTSPATGNVLPSTFLIPNHALRNAIEDWEDERARRRLALQAQLPPSPPTSTALVLADAPTLELAADAVDEPAATDAAAIDAAADAADAAHADPPAALTIVPLAEPSPSVASASKSARAAPALSARQRVLYTQSDGRVRAATVVAVHPGSPDDPEPFYTVALEDGTERETVASRLAPVEGGETVEACAALSASRDCADAAHADVPAPSPGRDGAVQLAEEEARRQEEARLAEEDARRQAVERSRLEARQARAERRMAAEEAEVARQARARQHQQEWQAQQQQRRQQWQQGQRWAQPGQPPRAQQTPPPRAAGGRAAEPVRSSGGPNPLDGLAEGWRNLRRDFEGALNEREQRQASQRAPPPQSGRTPGGAPPPNPLEEIGHAIGGAWQGAMDAIGNVARDLAGDQRNAQQQQQRPPQR
jgi:hypothetical protein